MSIYRYLYIDATIPLRASHPCKLRFGPTVFDGSVYHTSQVNPKKGKSDLEWIDQMGSQF